MQRAVNVRLGEEKATVCRQLEKGGWGAESEWGVG